MAELITMGDFVTQGERRAAERLRSLPADWTVICNKEVVLPSGRSYEVDFVIIGKHTIFVVEEKSWSGAIYGNENVWVLPNGEPRQSPLQKLGHIARQLAGSLRRQVPYLHNLTPSVHFVHELVLLSSDQLEFRVNDPRCRDRVVRLADAIVELPRLDSRSVDCDLVACGLRLKQVLTDLRDRPKHPKSIDTFEVREFLGMDAAGVRTYDATHESDKRRLIKLYPIDPIAGPTEVLLRGYRAASVAAEHGVAPAVDPYFRWSDGRYLAVPFHRPNGEPLCVPADEGLLSDAGPVLELVRAAFEALRKLHECGLVHRALNPRCIFRRHNPASVQFTDFGFAHLDQRQSIGEVLDELDVGDPFLAPECRIGFGLGEKASDVYSIVLSLCAFLTGDEPRKDVAAVEWVESQMRDVTRLWPVEIADGFVSLLRLCSEEEPRVRPTPHTAQAVIDGLLRGLNDAQPTSAPEFLGDGQYRVLRRLGEGASAVTYLVEDSFYGGQYVLKRIKNTELAQRFARAEFQALRDLNHPSLPRVYDVRQPQDDFHLKFQFIPGVELAHCMAEYRRRPDRLPELAFPLLDALDYLEQRGIAHRDLSPKNIIIPEDKSAPPCLIDFGLSKMREDARSSAVGTPLYRAPEVEQGRWTPASDVYALAVILYEAVVGCPPFGMVDGIADKQSRIQPPADAQRDVGIAVLDCLIRAMAPVTERFQSAASFKDALEVACESRRDGTDENHPEGDRVCLDWVLAIRGLYRNSAGGNADNRGLDSDFARKTYVPTLLDRQLLPDILDGKRRLVFLTGNPGDGKTAFLEMLRAAAESRTNVRLLSDRYGWRTEPAGNGYEAVFDASESRGLETSDRVLARVLAPFSGPNAPDWQSCPVTLIAINDGRLFEFLETYAAGFEWLRKCVDEQTFGDGPTASEVAIVDLKKRTLTGMPGATGSLFGLMASRVLKAEHWIDCRHCRARQTCHIKFNVDSLRDPGVLNRLETLLLTQHWRRERRATIRDVRSAFAFVLTSNLSCGDVHAEQDAIAKPQNAAERAYYHAVFNVSNARDELLNEMAVLDPATRPHARLDRFLHFHKGAERQALLRELFREVPDRSDLPNEVATVGDWHAAMKRRIYFERSYGELQTRLQRWDLPKADGLLLPYLFLDRFMDALIGRINLDRIRDQLLAGISRSEGIPAQVAGNRLSLALSRNTREELTVIKQVDARHFVCRIPSSRHCEYAESIPDALELSYTTKSISLPITLDMFELLMRMAEGYTAGTLEFAPFLVELAEFKARLVRLGVEEVLLLEGRSRLHKVAVEDRRIVYKGAL